MSSKKDHRDATILTHHGRHPEEQHGFVNTPVTRGSTVIFPTLDALENGNQQYRYGRLGNPSSTAVEALVTELENATGTVLASSGLGAISTALLSVVESGDEILVTDSVYGPTRKFCDNVLAKLGVRTRYFDPRAGAGIESGITASTKAIFLESPGSLTFEVQDMPAITAVAEKHGLFTIADNSWATPLFLKPLDMGVDIVVHAGTKMFVGHSDAMFGTASANARAWPALAQTHNNLGAGASPDDCFLAARGMRTLELRMKAHQASALALAEWLEKQPMVKQVLHPALPTHPDHDLFKRDFAGAGSLFSFILEPAPRTAIAAMVDALALYGMGFSWGGYESLILPCKPAPFRTATGWREDGNVMRVHVGLEDIEDLKTDLGEGLARYKTAMG